MDYLCFLFFIMSILVFLNLFFNKNIWKYDKQKLNTMFNKELFSVKGISKLKNKIPKTNLGSSKLNKNLLIGSPFNVDKNCVSPAQKEGWCELHDKKTALESCKNYQF